MNHPWTPELSAKVAWTKADGFAADGVEAIWYDGATCQGRPTRVFAWLGRPRRASIGKLPAVVLVHGGVGTAFDDWVRLWTSRGFVAIAMDTCGCTPTPEGMPRNWNYPWPRHEHAGPAGWGGFERVDDPVGDQWMYHAVACALRARTLLGQLDYVDPARIGLTGISWGGIIACTVAGVDSRLQWVAPVYGSGFLARAPLAGKVPPHMREKWLAMWDPSRFLAGAKMPMLWVNGTNDPVFPLDAQQLSYRLAPGPRTLAVRVRMVHAHGGPGEKPEEIHAFARTHAGLALPVQGLAQITASGLDNSVAWATYEVPSRVCAADLVYTFDEGPWAQRRWLTAPGDINHDKLRVTASLPTGAKACFMNLWNQWGELTSTEHVCP
jgi:dienelactone hydrolase